MIRFYVEEVGGTPWHRKCGNASSRIIILQVIAYDPIPEINVRQIYSWILLVIRSDLGKARKGSVTFLFPRPRAKYWLDLNPFILIPRKSQIKNESDPIGCRIHIPVGSRIWLVIWYDTGSVNACQKHFKRNKTPLYFILSSWTFLPWMLSPGSYWLLEKVTW